MISLAEGRDDRGQLYVDGPGGGTAVKASASMVVPSAEEMSESRVTCLNIRVSLRLISWAVVNALAIKTSMRNTSLCRCGGIKGIGPRSESGEACKSFHVDRVHVLGVASLCHVL
jgi:hypothetical protein